MVMQGGKAENFEKSGYKTRTEEIQRPRPLKTEDGATAWLEQIDPFIHGQFDVAQDGAKQARTERFASVHGDSGRSVKAKFNDFAHAFHQGVEFLGLGVATASHVFPKHPDGRRAGTVPT